MPYFYLFLAMVFSALITVAGRFYSNKTKNVANVSSLYSLLTPAFSALGWLILWGSDFSFDSRVLPYSVLYGLCYSFFTVGMLGAIQYGSTSLTALVKQLALVGVSFWGLFFWDTQFQMLSILGVVLLVISLLLCLLNKESKTEGYHMGKWLFFCGLIAVGNAGCAITQRYQQMAFDYQHKNIFMFFALLFSTAFCSIPAVREEKTNWKATIKSAWLFPAMAGSSSALSNVFILLLVKNQMSPVILYPGVAVGGLILTTLIATLCFRERLRGKQWLGLAFGAVALILLNL